MPFFETDATFLFEEVKITFLKRALWGVTNVFNSSLSPVAMASFGLFVILIDLVRK